MLAETIINLLNRLNGFDGWWYSIDETTRSEILEELQALIEVGEL